MFVYRLKQDFRKNVRRFEGFFVKTLDNGEQKTGGGEDSIRVNRKK